MRRGPTTAVHVERREAKLKGIAGIFPVRDEDGREQGRLSLSKDSFPFTSSANCCKLLYFPVPPLLWLKDRHSCTYLIGIIVRI